MIYNISLGPLSDEEEKVRQYLKEKQFKRVLDVGGAQRPWARPYVTHYLDLISPYDWARRYPEMLKFEGFWEKNFIKQGLNLRFVKENSKPKNMFDFVICSQTLEHVENPELFLTGLSMVGFHGFISIPHKLFELKKGIHWGQPFRGSLPHRWISVIRNETLVMLPKLNFIDCIDFSFDKEDKPIPDLSFWWKDKIPCNIIDDSHIDFPDPQEAMRFYKEYLDNNNPLG